MSSLYARQAITTTFHGPTDTKGSRVTARAAAGSCTVECEDSYSIEDNHAAAARKLAERFNWAGRFFIGSIHRGGYVFVLADEPDTLAFTLTRRPER